MPRHGRDAAPGLPILNGAPWYVKLVIWALMWFGFPVVACVVFLMIFVGYIPSPITETRHDLRAHRAEMVEVLRSVQTSIRLHRQVCRNTSTNPAERVECDR